MISSILAIGFYKPSLGRWLTPDPLSFEDGPNLYAYLKNNPFTHFDPYGLEGISWSDSSMEFGNHFCSNFLGSAIDPVGACFNCDNSLTGAAYYGNFAGRAVGVCCSLAFWELTAAKMTASAIGNCAKGVGGPLFQRVMGQTTKRVGSQLVERRSAMLPAQKMVDSFSRVGNSAVEESLLQYKINYIPKCPITGKPLTLPRNQHGANIPSSDTAHTQLGWHAGRKGDYPQTRQWGANKKPIKTTDWTDHGRPCEHSNPHDHIFGPNATGGTPKYGDAQPFKIFN
jgi:uncharacterized protein RhaS with RHS repeats